MNSPHEHSDGCDADDLTGLLSCCQAGDSSAEERLYAAIYQRLHAMARGRMRGVPPTDTLQPTALVHEAWMRMIGRQAEGYSGRRHFFALASRAMHDIVVEQARRHETRRRGGSWKRVDLGDHAATSGTSTHDMLALSDALTALKAAHPEAWEVVMLRFFGGLSHGEIAKALDLSLSKVRREWAYAKAWLHRKLFEPGADSEADP